MNAAPTSRWRILRRFTLPLVALIGTGLLIPEDAVVPVAGATRRDWNPKSFWYEPWGVSGVHKGIDIFAPRGRPVLAAVPGIVVYRGSFRQGGEVVAVLGPKWRLHYYAHLDEHAAGRPLLVARGSQLGTVGTSGNAAGKPPHLHYTVFSLLPLPWRYSTATQGWRRMFYLDPGEILPGR